MGDVPKVSWQSDNRSTIHTQAFGLLKPEVFSGLQGLRDPRMSGPGLRRGESLGTFSSAV